MKTIYIVLAIYWIPAYITLIINSIQWRKNNKKHYNNKQFMKLYKRAEIFVYLITIILGINIFFFYKK